MQHRLRIRRNEPGREYNFAMTEPQPLQQIDRTYVRVGNRKLSYFAGCDYFRLASHPRVLRAMEQGLRKFGLNVAASRMTTGNHKLFGKLEEALVNFFACENAVLVANGYATNLIVAQTLAGKFSHVLIDEKAHGSLRDAAQFLDCPILEIKHRDPNDLSCALARCGRDAKPILLTDGMFSHDGSIAPLKNYLKLLPGDSLILVDDAHGAGTLGATGKGTVEFEGIDRRRVIQTMTLSKAFGVYGGAILCSGKLRREMFAQSRMLIGSTPLPLPLVNAALASIAIVQKDKRLRERLARNVDHAKTKLRHGGFPVVDSPGPLISVMPRNALEAVQLQTRCLANGIFPSFIRYPAGPKHGYFRFAISSEHTQRQLDTLLKTLLAAKV